MICWEPSLSLREEEKRDLVIPYSNRGYQHELRNFISDTFSSSGPREKQRQSNSQEPIQQLELGFWMPPSGKENQGPLGKWPRRGRNKVSLKHVCCFRKLGCPQTGGLCQRALGPAGRACTAKSRIPGTVKSNDGDGFTTRRKTQGGASPGGCQVHLGTHASAP